MANRNLDQDGQETLAKKSGGGGIVKVLIIVLVALALVGAGSGAAYFLLMDQSAAEQTAESKDTKGKKGKNKKRKKGEKAKEKAPKVEIFFPMDPPLVVNFTNPRPMRFLQIQMEVLVHSEETVADIKKYAPIIRNNLVIMLSGLDSQSLMSREGKEKVRADILAEIKAILTERTGKAKVEQVYFTGFVMQ